MSGDENQNSALVAARAADEQVMDCVRAERCFLLEAGAGSGKTYSLVETLKNLLRTEGARLRRSNQRIACLTYTNVATAVISGRVDGNPLVRTETIHAFCWSLIKGFQPALRVAISKLEVWQERLATAGNIGKRRIEYELGNRRVTDELVSLHHDDVLTLTAALLPLEKFQAILVARHPYILIDEYQDTSLEIMTAIKTHLIGRKGGPLIGLFGDHWQRIYDKTCGRVTHGSIQEVCKGANFRSAAAVVKVLNAMRPELTQVAANEASAGSAVVYHTNAWIGERRTGAGGGHWKGDLPADTAHEHLADFVANLSRDGWDVSAGKTKILMLTHNVLASEQGYANLKDIFDYTDDYLKKQDAHISFFTDKLEPACEAYRRKKYGEMFELLGNGAPKLSSHADKVTWTSAMDGLLELRDNASIGALVDHIRASGYPQLPDSIAQREDRARHWKATDGALPPDDVKRVRQLRDIAYREVVALDQFIDGHTPFATKHSVKGDEFENVVVVLGRGWNRYDFNQYLEWAAAPAAVPAKNRDAYERSRNLFYVSCSRPTTRLALLFTQLLSNDALATLKSWFGADSVRDVAR
ncbi:MAG: helicase [Myxococcaceae bacterium]|nr:helicase [Myxococcaceae bacterium]